MLEAPAAGLAAGQTRRAELSSREPDAGAAFGAVAAERFEAEQRAELSAAAQRSRRDEIAERIARTHREAGRMVVRTDVLDGGMTVDWVDRATVEGSDAQLPPSPPLVPTPEGVSLAQPPRLIGPPDALPYIRPTFEPYVQGRTVARDLDEYIRTLPSGHPAEFPGGSSNRLYVGARESQANFGAEGRFNAVWSGTQVPGGPDFAIFEIAVACQDSAGATTDMIGPIIGRHPAVYTGGTVFGLERFIGGVGRWVTPASQNGFVQTHAGWAPGLVLPDASSVGGVQWEYEIGAYYAASVGATPARWWITLGYQWIGYFPASLFSDLAAGACRATWYGEMFDNSSSTTSWMNADMGSGLFPWSSAASGNLGSAASIRVPRFSTTPITGGFNYALPTVDSSLLIINHAYCYDGRWTTDGASGVWTVWTPTLWLGGPGGDAVGCNADPGGRFGFQPQAGAYVCSPGCTQCGGAGCSSAGTQPGDVCCTGAITSSGRDCLTKFAPCKIKSADPECRTGVLHAEETHCCGAGCTQCGGPGCDSAGGCCVGPINSAGNLCSGSMPPCKMWPPPKVP